jgi:hypothetical protein
MAGSARSLDWKYNECFTAMALVNCHVVHGRCLFLVGFAFHYAGFSRCSSRHKERNRVAEYLPGTASVMHNILLMPLSLG